jgi:hypothetical protein
VAVRGGAAAACPTGALPAYAHNDYRNARPLHDALDLGFRGAEADLFLVNGTLRVGHDRREATRGAAFEAAYVAPLAALVARCGPLVTDGAPFLLAVDLKRPDAAAFDTLVAVLARHPALAPRVQVVLVNWFPPPDAWGADARRLLRTHRRLHHPRDAVAAPDATLALLSVDYGHTLGRPWTTRARRRAWLAAIADARRRAGPGVRLRVHAVPARARLYAELRAAGADLVGTKSIARTARLLDAR